MAFQTCWLINSRLFTTQLMFFMSVAGGGRVHVGAMQPLPMWMHPIEFTKISKTSIPISLLKDVRHPTASTWCFCGTAVFGKKLIVKNVRKCNFIKRITQLKHWYCGPDKGPFYTYAHVICIYTYIAYNPVYIYIYNRAVYKCINLYTYTHSLCWCCSTGVLLST
jgi:hypothetical protein